MRVNQELSVYSQSEALSQRARGSDSRRTLKFVGNILAGPPQVAKTLLKWHHNYKKLRQYKRKISYSEQIRHIWHDSVTGERDPLSPMTKKMRLVEVMDYLQV